MRWSPKLDATGKKGRSGGLLEYAVRVGYFYILGLPSIEFGPLFYTQVIVGLTPTKPTFNLKIINKYKFK